MKTNNKTKTEVIMNKIMELVEGVRIEDVRRMFGLRADAAAVSRSGASERLLSLGLGFLTGAVAGAGMTLLLAPGRRNEVRQSIDGHFAFLRDRARQMVASAKAVSGGAEEAHGHNSARAAAVRRGDGLTS
jgi:hypothetical protein